MRTRSAGAQPVPFTQATTRHPSPSQDAPPALPSTRTYLPAFSAPRARGAAPAWPAHRIPCWRPWRRVATWWPTEQAPPPQRRWRHLKPQAPNANSDCASALPLDPHARQAPSSSAGTAAGVGKAATAALAPTRFAPAPRPARRVSPPLLPAATTGAVAAATVAAADRNQTPPTRATATRHRRSGRARRASKANVRTGPARPPPQSVGGGRRGRSVGRAVGQAHCRATHTPQTHAHARRPRAARECHGRGAAVAGAATHPTPHAAHTP